MPGHLIVLSLPETALNRWLDRPTVCWLLLICINGGCMPQRRKISRNAIYPASVWLDGLVQTGRRSNATADSYGWTALRYVHVATIRATLPEQCYAVATVNMVLAALKGVAQ